ncbi:hypothetical protein pb186bvf_006074 [Paramecium bursaria]
MIAFQQIQQHHYLLYSTKSTSNNLYLTYYLDNQNTLLYYLIQTQVEQLIIRHHSESCMRGTINRQF